MLQEAQLLVFHVYVIFRACPGCGKRTKKGATGGGGEASDGRVYSIMKNREGDTEGRRARAKERRGKTDKGRRQREAGKEAKSRMSTDSRKGRETKRGKGRRNPEGRRTRRTERSREESMHGTGPHDSERRGAHSEKRQRMGIGEREEENARGARGGGKQRARMWEDEEQSEAMVAEGIMRGESGAHESKRRRMGMDGQQEYSRSRRWSRTRRKARARKVHTGTGRRNRSRQQQGCRPQQR